MFGFFAHSITSGGVALRAIRQRGRVGAAVWLRAALAKTSSAAVQNLAFVNSWRRFAFSRRSTRLFGALRALSVLFLPPLSRLLGGSWSRPRRCQRHGRSKNAVTQPPLRPALVGKGQGWPVSIAILLAIGRPVKFLLTIPAPGAKIVLLGGGTTVQHLTDRPVRVAHRPFCCYPCPTSFQNRRSIVAFLGSPINRTYLLRARRLPPLSCNSLSAIA